MEHISTISMMVWSSNNVSTLFSEINSVEHDQSKNVDNN